MPDAPPLTGEGVAGVPTTPSAGVGTSSGGNDMGSAGTPGAEGGSLASAGGASGSSPGGSSSGDTAGGPTTMEPPNPNGYYTAGSWKGRAWAKTTGSGTTIMPSSFADVPMGMPYCASGSVVALPDYSGTATIGVNLNQAIEAMAEPKTTVPTDEGVIVEVTNRGDSVLRLEIRGPNGETDQNQRWCAPISGSGGFLAWSSFNTACWDDSGAAYAREPIVSASVLVPGDDEDVVTFDVCLNGIEEGAAADAGTAGSPGTGNAGASNGTAGSAGTPNAGSGGGPGGSGSGGNAAAGS